jgi:hypothetical protein
VYLYQMYLVGFLKGVVEAPKSATTMELVAMALGASDRDRGSDVCVETTFKLRLRTYGKVDSA